MTRFGMKEKDFKALAALMGDFIKNGTAIKGEVIKLRGNFMDMRFCFKESEFGNIAASLISELK